MCVQCLSVYYESRTFIHEYVYKAVCDMCISLHISVHLYRLPQIQRNVTGFTAAELGVSFCKYHVCVSYIFMGYGQGCQPVCPSRTDPITVLTPLGSHDSTMGPCHTSLADWLQIDT